MKAYTLEQAEQWFLNNSVGGLTCVKDGREESCDSYPSAKAFFTESVSQPDDDSTAIGLGFMSGAVMGDIASCIEASNPEPSIDTTPDTSSLSEGGGDFGGAGSGGDY